MNDAFGSFHLHTTFSGTVLKGTYIVSVNTTFTLLHRNIRVGNAVF